MTMFTAHTVFAISFHNFDVVVNSVLTFIIYNENESFQLFFPPVNLIVCLVNNKSILFQMNLVRILAV